MEKKSCSRCIWGKSNIDTIECWRFNKEKDVTGYKNTLDREYKRYELNKNNDCTYYEKWTFKYFFKSVKDSLKESVNRILCW